MILSTSYFRIINSLFYTTLIILLSLPKVADASNKKQIHKSVEIKLSSFDIDVTPRIGQQMAFEPVVNTWDLGLRAKGIVIQGSGDPIVLIGIDWLGISFEAYDTFKSTIASAAGTIPENVAIHALHQHDAPVGKNLNEYVLSVLNRLEEAIKQSLNKTRNVTHVGFGEAEVFEIASNRRILDSNGYTVRAGRMSTSRDSLLRAEPEGVIDPIVSVVSFWNKEEPLAVLSFYATHPQSYYRTGIPNPDFPGVARFHRQLAVPEALHIHFTGAAGNVAAGKYNDGSKENRGILAKRLADGMKRAWESSKIQPISSSSLGWDITQITLPADTTKNNDYVERYKIGAKIDIQCLTLNDGRVLFMPGELFVEYQLAAKSMLPDKFVAMVAYGDYSPGYIPTANAFPQGGFEVRASKVTPQAEAILIGAIKNLLNIE